MPERQLNERETDLVFVLGSIAIEGFLLPKSTIEKLIDDYGLNKDKDLILQKLEVMQVIKKEGNGENK